MGFRLRSPVPGLNSARRLRRPQSAGRSLAVLPQRWVSHFCEARALGAPLTATSQVATISKAAALA
jgi:hypothetical protein